MPRLVPESIRRQRPGAPRQGCRILNRYATACAATALLANFAAGPVNAHKAPSLLHDRPPAGFRNLFLPEEGRATREAVRGDPAVIDLRVGIASPEAVRKARALSLVLPAPPSAGAQQSVSFHALKLEERTARDYSLRSYDESSGSEVSLVVMGPDVLGTIRHDGEVYRVRPLGGGHTAIYRYDS